MPRTVTSNNEFFAGYTLNDPSDSSLHVTATFVVPKLSCGSRARAMSPEDGMEADTEFSSAGLFVGCYGGKAHYWPTLAVNGIRTNYKTGSAAHPGDTVVLTASENATKTSVSVVDKTHKFTKRETGSVLLTWSTTPGYFAASIQKYTVLTSPVFFWNGSKRSS